MWWKCRCMGPHASTGTGARRLAELELRAACGLAMQRVARLKRLGIREEAANEARMFDAVLLIKQGKSRLKLRRFL